MALHMAIMFAGISLTSAQDTVSAEELIQLAMKQRQSITKATATFRSVLEQPEKKDAVKEPAEYRIRMWLDGTRLRNDVLSGVRQVKCSNCPKDGQAIELWDFGRPAVSVYLKRMSKRFDTMFLDPRVLGLQVVSREILWSYGIDSILGRADRSKPSFEKGKWQGHDCYVVRFELKGPKTKCAYTIVPSMDHSVVRVDAENKTSDNKRWSGTCECVMQRYGKPGVWFPKTCVTESKFDGKLDWRDTIEVSDVTLNEPLPENTFSLEGMHVPIGALISDVASPNKLFEWNGKAPVEVQPPAKKSKQSETPPPAQQGGNPPRTMLFGASGALAVLALAALGLFYRKR